MEVRTEAEILEFALASLALSQYHPHYKKTCEVAKYWRSIVCGENQESIILKKRENDTRTQKEQTVRLFNTHTPYLTNRLKSVFKKVDKTKRVNQVIELDKRQDSKSEAFSAFQEQVTDFYKDESLDEYLNTRLIDYASTDPNSYLLIDFFPFDNEREYPTIYPMVFPAEDVVLKYEDHEGLAYVGFRKSVLDKKPDESGTKVKNPMILKPDDFNFQKEYYKYFIYTREYSYEIISKDIADEIGYNVEGAELFTRTFSDNGKTKAISFYIKTGQHFSGNVPAICLGYVQDLKTAYETKESIYRPAMEIFNEHCEKKSKLDNQMALFGFIRAYAYAQRCNFQDDQGNYCVDGRVGDHICGKCHGSGVREKTSRVSRNEFEITEIELPLPVSGDVGDIIDLTKLFHMVEVPEQVFKLYQEQVDHLSKLTSLALFNTNIFDKYNNESGAETATGIRELAQSKNNVIHEYAEHKARVWRFIVEQILHYFNLSEAVTANMVFDEDLVPLSDEELIKLISESKNANVSMEYIRALETDLMSLKYKNAPNELLWFSEKNKWKPFFNKSESEVAMTLSMLPSDHPKKILWLFFEEIFSEIKNAERLEGFSGTKYDQRFPNLEFSEQKDVINFYIEAYKEQIASQDVFNIDLDS